MPNLLSDNLFLILGEQDWDRASFQIEVSDLIQLITEDRLRHARGPVHFNITSPVHLCFGEPVDLRCCVKLVLRTRILNYITNELELSSEPLISVGLKCVKSA